MFLFLVVLWLHRPYPEWFFFFFFFLMGLGFELRLRTCKAGYHLSHTSSPLCSSYFGDWGISRTFPGLASNHNPSDPASQVARITGMGHWCPALDNFLYMLSNSRLFKSVNYNNFWNKYLHCFPFALLGWVLHPGTSLMYLGFGAFTLWFWAKIMVRRLTGLISKYFNMLIVHARTRKIIEFAIY
jgi:hypothetical protein